MKKQLTNMIDGEYGGDAVADTSGGRHLLPLGKASKHRPSLASRIDRALRVEANRRRMRLMDGAR